MDVGAPTRERGEYGNHDGGSMTGVEREETGHPARNRQNFLDLPLSHLLHICGIIDTSHEAGWIGRGRHRAPFPVVLPFHDDN